MTEDAIQTFPSVWDALADTPLEAANLKLRSELLIALSTAVEGWRVTKAEAASRLGVTRGKLDDLVRGRIGEFSVDDLVGLAEHAGLRVRMEITQTAA